MAVAGDDRLEATHPNVLRTRAGAIVLVSPDQVFAVDSDFEGRVQVVVLERQHIVGQPSGRRSDFPVTFEEEPLDLAAFARDLESERDVGAVGDDDGVPEAIDGWGRMRRSSRREQRAGHEQRGRQFLHCLLQKCQSGHSEPYHVTWQATCPNSGFVASASSGRGPPGRPPRRRSPAPSTKSGGPPSHRQSPAGRAPVSG